jgi:hypothetical protein
LPDEQGVPLTAAQLRHETELECRHVRQEWSYVVLVYNKIAYLHNLKAGLQVFVNDFY